MATLEELRRQRMQEQYNQPVYGPRNPPPAQPVQDTRPVIAQGDIGGALYGLGRALTSPQPTDQNAMMRSRFGVAPTAPATAATVPAQPGVAPQSTPAATAAPQQTNFQVLEQDRANMRAANFAPIAGPQPDTTLSQDSLAGVNQRIQAALDANRAPAQIPGERGNYNLANTSNVDAQGNITSRLRQPENIIEGGYGQFGGGRAQQYLAQFQNQPRRNPLDVSDEIRLRNQLTSDNPFERRAAREQMATRQALALDAGATQRAGMQVAGEQARASLAGAAAVQAAQASAVGKQQAAELAGQYGLQQAQTRAQGAVTAAETSAGSGSNLLSRVRAEQEARKLAVAQAAFEAGDVEAGNRALGIAQPTAPRLSQDEFGNVISLDGRPVTQAEAEAFRRARGYYAVPPQ